MLLLTNRKASAVKRLLLRNIVATFDERRPEPDLVVARQLRSIEGTVILQVNFAVTQDQTLGKEFMKMFNNEIAIKPFSLALLFSLARISFLEDDAFRQLKTAVLGSFADLARRRTSSWIESLNVDSLELALDRILLQTVSNSAAGWDHITPSLVKFGFVLVDSTGAWFSIA